MQFVREHRNSVLLLKGYGTIAACGVDTVMPESDDYDLDDRLLPAMKEYWL